MSYFSFSHVIPEPNGILRDRKQVTYFPFLIWEFQIHLVYEFSHKRRLFKFKFFSCQIEAGRFHFFQKNFRSVIIFISSK